MIAFAVLVIVVALLVYGLERNHRRWLRRGPMSGGTLVGSSDVVDRDVERLAVDLTAIAADRPVAPSGPAPVRVAPAAAPGCRPATR
jgi:hypothetical protein